MNFNLILDIIKLFSKMENFQVQYIKTKMHIHIQTCHRYINEMKRYIPNTESNLLCELKDTNRYTFRLNTLVSNKTLNIINDFININNLNIDLNDFELFRKYRLITLIIDYLDKNYNLNDSDKIMYSHQLCMLIMSIIPFWSEYCCEDKCDCDWENKDEDDQYLCLCSEYCPLSVDDHIFIWHMDEIIILQNSIIENVPNDTIKCQNIFTNIIMNDIDVLINNMKTNLHIIETNI